MSKGKYQNSRRYYNINYLHIRRGEEPLDIFKTYKQSACLYRVSGNKVDRSDNLFGIYYVRSA